MFTSGKWKITESGRCVVTNIPLDGIEWEENEFLFKCYGGYPICESINSHEDAILISKSKELYNLLKEVVFICEVCFPKPLNYSLYINYKKLIVEIEGIENYKFCLYYIIPQLYIKFPFLIKEAPLYPHHSYYSVENNFKS